MDGVPPLGYDVCDRRLVVNQAEVATVKHIYERYLELRFGPALEKRSGTLLLRARCVRARCIDGVDLESWSWKIYPGAQRTVPL